MELTQKRIYKDIEEIKNTIECSKRNYTGPYKLFLLYGTLQGVLLVLNLFSAVIWGASDNGAMFNFASQMICSAIIGIFYFLIYKNERRASNRYYLSTLSIWGILAISTPFILFATRLVLL